MCLAEDIGIPIFYQDTDSMHIYETDIAKLSEAFMEKYGTELVGEDLTQFHSDFDFKDEAVDKSTICSTGAYFLGKKSYVDRLTANTKPDNDGKCETLPDQLHARMKGIPTDVLKLLANKKFKGETEVDRCINLYKKLFDGEVIEFDLMKGKTCFDMRSNFTVRTRDKFVRKIVFPTIPGMIEEWEDGKRIR